MKIECEIGGHRYATEQLYYEDFTTIGFMLSEKIAPFITCLLACLGNNLSDNELLKALYSSSKEVFNRDDMKFISELVLNREHLTIDGKKLDKLGWEKHWQSGGFIDYQAVVYKFIEGNLGNFTQLSALMPAHMADKLQERLGNKFSLLSDVLKNLFQI